jgi:flagellar motility protein MotE (MotC chaperone)
VDSTSPPAAPAPTATTGAAPADTLQRTQLRRLSRIFAAMSPREASRVLQQLDDTDVISIVGSLTEKQAAAVLMAMPPDRAAVISRGSLRRAPGRTP